MLKPKISKLSHWGAYGIWWCVCFFERFSIFNTSFFWDELHVDSFEQIKGDQNIMGKLVTQTFDMPQTRNICISKIPIELLRWNEMTINLGFIDKRYTIRYDHIVFFHLYLSHCLTVSVIHSLNHFIPHSIANLSIHESIPSNINIIIIHKHFGIG